MIRMLRLGLESFTTLQTTLRLKQLHNNEIASPPGLAQFYITCSTAKQESWSQKHCSENELNLEGEVLSI